MEAVFHLDISPLAADVRFEALAAELAGHCRIGSSADFNTFCRAAITRWPGHPGGELIGSAGSVFTDLVLQIEEGGPEIIRTGWGGVVVTKHEPPRVEKFLVIHRGGFLALEKHARKDEHLEVREGAGLLLWRRNLGEPLAVQALEAGQEFHFFPGIEHCFIGIENLLLFERSLDPLGMDRDLIFLYEPDAAAT